MKRNTASTRHLSRRSPSTPYDGNRQLRAARHLDIATTSAALDRALAAYERSGVGGYRVIDPGGDPTVVAALEQRGIRVRRFPNGRFAIIPALDQIGAAAETLRAIRATAGPDGLS